MHQNEVTGGHAEVLAQLVGAHDAGQVLGQRVEQGVVHAGLVLRNGKGNKDEDKDGHDGHRMLGNKVAQLGQPGDDGAVLVFFHPFIKGKDQRG